MELRSNQVEPVRIGIEFFRRNKPVPSIIVAPTAFGKSIVVAKIAESIADNVLILQPSKELLEQNFGKYVALGGRAAVYSASFNSKKIGQVTYATIGSIKNIGSTFKEMGFTKMIIDEVHLFPRTADSMIGKFLKESEITHVLGLTATPLKLQTNRDRSGDAFSKLVMLTSRSKKGQFFKEIIYVSQVKEMVDLGFWSKLEYEQYDMDYRGLVFNSTKADYTEESLQRVYESNDIHRKILQKVIDLRDRKSILVFVPSVEDAQKLSSQTPNSAAVYGDMDPKLRTSAVAGFRSGRIRVIYNVNVLSVGFDHPGLDAIICGRPTASLAWFYQALGRGTRIAPGKVDCLIVDFSGNVRRFGRIEKLYFKKENIWKLYGEDGRLLTGCPLHEIGMHTENSEAQRTKNPPILPPTTGQKVMITFGKHKGTEVKNAPAHWRKWIYEEFTKNGSWNKYNTHIKAEIERINSLVTR